jgi:hypothetical protein
MASMTNRQANQLFQIKLNLAVVKDAIEGIPQSESTERALRSVRLASAWADRLIKDANRTEYIADSMNQTMFGKTA